MIISCYTATSLYPLPGIKDLVHTGQVTEDAGVGNLWDKQKM